MTSSKIPQNVEKAAHPDRRGSKRIPKIQPCLYELAHVADYEDIEFSDGHALSLNMSAGGFLLLMSQSPEKRQVFEVHMSLQTEEKATVELVEACWMREISFGDIGKVHLVGVRSLFQPARFN